MENKPTLLVIVALLTLNAWRLQRKYARKETASYDGDERPVTKADVLIACGMVLFFIGAYIYCSLWNDP